jgi:geranylgeranyl diphosphate synthase type 3
VSHFLFDCPEIKAIVEMLHTASLLLDDIEDNSELRRGIPVAHRIYGVPSTINSANYMMFLAMSKTNKLGSAEATAAFLDEMLKLHEGCGSYF